MRDSTPKFLLLLYQELQGLFYSLQLFLFDELLVFKKRMDIAMEQAEKKRIGNHSNKNRIKKPMGTLSSADTLKLGNICGY